MSAPCPARHPAAIVSDAVAGPPARLLGGIFSRALILIGTGIAAGNAVLITVVTLSEEVDLATVSGALMMTSGVMLTVGLLACAEPGRRAMRISVSNATTTEDDVDRALLAVSTAWTAVARR